MLCAFVVLAYTCFPDQVKEAARVFTQVIGPHITNLSTVLTGLIVVLLYLCYRNWIKVHGVLWWGVGDYFASLDTWAYRRAKRRDSESTIPIKTQQK